MNVVFATGGLVFNGSYLQQRSLGGSETALASMALELARIGHKVTVFCHCDAPGWYDNVQYIDVSEFGMYAQAWTIDVLIISRFGDLWQPGITGALNIYWQHDMPPSAEDFMAFALKADKILALSDFHIAEFLEEKKCPIEKVIEKTANGVDIDLIEEVGARISKRKPKRFVYTSLPERGLLHLLEKVWPRIIQKHPDAELYIAGYDVSSIASRIDDTVKLVRQRTDAMIAAMPSVHTTGPLCKADLYKLMQSAVGMLYPCTFPEVFCITAVEAQACGLPVITTNRYALSETVGPENNFLIEGAGQEYLDNFTAAAIELLDHPEISEAAQVSGPKWVRQQGYVWKQIAAAWDRMFHQEFAKRQSEHPSRIISTMYRQGDALQAKMFRERCSFEHEIKSPALELLKTAPPAARILEDVDKDVIYRLVYDLWVHERPGIEEKTEITLCDLGDDPGGFGAYAKSRCEKISLVDSMFAKPDLLYIGSALAAASSPHERVKYTSDPDLILSATPSGRVAFNEDVAATQLWSFTSADLNTLLGDMAGFVSTPAGLFISERGEKLNFWIAAYENKGEVSKIDLRVRANRFRPEQTISGCVISKNEEKWITMCLHELAPVVDEIVLVDSNSTDRTVEFAEKFGVRVTKIDFDNFAAARNTSLDQARGDWIFWIDCDERLIGGANLRSYVDGVIPNGFIIDQVHLVIDDQRGKDTPIRLVRNKPEFRFVGMIHEHIEDVSDPSVFSKQIKPVYHPVDVKLAHYGYVHEKHRRQKCILRNMDLLIRDCEVNLPMGRTMCWVLAMRDYLNAVKWFFQQQGNLKVTNGAYEHYLLNEVVNTYHSIFRNRVPDLEGIVRPMYEEALSLLCANKIHYAPTKLVPFQMAVYLMGSPEPVPKSDAEQMVPKLMYFIHPDEVREFLDNQHGALADRWFPHVPSSAAPFKWAFNPGCADPVKVLTEIRERYKRG